MMSDPEPTVTDLLSRPDWRAQVPGGLRDLIELRVGVPFRLEIVPGGLVHLVARAGGPKGSLILKQRLSHCVGLPTIAIRPEEIKAEARALTLVGAIAPALFPRGLDFFNRLNLLVETDEATNRQTLPSWLSSREDEAVVVIFQTLAGVVAGIHAATATSGISVREDGDTAFLARNLYERIGFLGTDWSGIVAALAGRPRQLTLGDLSPKNILIGESADLCIVDLEHVHRGPAILDLAFLLAHAFLTLAPRSTRVRLTSLATINAGYAAISPILPPDDELLGPSVLALLRYRLESPVVPYDFGLPPTVVCDLDAALQGLSPHTDLATVWATATAALG